MIPRQRPQVPAPQAPDLAGRCLRINGDYRVVAHHELAPEHRATFEELATGRDHYGLLVPVERPALGVKAINVPVARMLDQIARQGVLPACDAADRELHVQVARLVLDGVVEVRAEHGFVTGPAAHDLLALRIEPDGGTDRLQALSRAAIELASELDDDDPRTRSSWLYGYNTVPLGPQWERLLGPDDAAIERALGLDAHGSTRRRLDEGFSVHRVGMWISWHRHDDTSDAPHCAYKLYVSPRPEVLYDVFDAIARTMVEIGVRSFKLGSGVHGLLRPDKLVAYVETWEQLRTLAQALVHALPGVEAQGVPFTAPLDPAGLLSWGMDPPEHARLPGWGTVESWRVWLTNRLARALIVARAWGLRGPDARDHALSRLRMEGVDPRLWSAAEALWQPEDDA